MAGWNNSSLSERLGSLHPAEENVAALFFIPFLSSPLYLLHLAPFLFIVVNSLLSDQTFYTVLVISQIGSELESHVFMFIYNAFWQSFVCL